MTSALDCIKSFVWEVLRMDIEAELLKSMPKDELDLLVSDRIKSYHGLLTKEVALRLIAREKGLLKAEEEKEYKLADIPKGAKKVSFSASVSRIWPIATYSSGKRSRVIEVSDAEITKPLILWNDDVELAKGMRLKDGINVKGAYESNGEIHLGYSGRLEVAARAPFTELGALVENERAHIRGIVSKVEGTGTLEIMGRRTNAFIFTISDGAIERKCIVWEGPDRAHALKGGDEVILEGAELKGGMLLLDNSSRMHMRRAREMLIGEITRLECENEKLDIKVGERELLLEREDALRLLKAEVADDIALSTVVSLKKDALINSRIAIRAREKDGRIVIGG
jgi:hypothetical protein